MRWWAFFVYALSVASAAYPAETITYQYDARSRVTQVSHSGTVNSGLQSGYGYDKADNRTVRTITSNSPYDPAADAYFAAMTVQPSSARKTLINNLIVGLKSDGLWTKIGWLSLVAAHDAQAARLNAINPTQSATAVGGPVFTVDRGYQGTGNNEYLDTGVLMTASGNFSRNSGFFSVYSNSNGIGPIFLTSGWWQTGGGGTKNLTSFTAWPGVLYQRNVSNTASSTPYAGAYTTANVLNTASRTASNASAVYQGAVQQSTGTVAPSTIEPTNSVTIGIIGGYSDSARYAFFAWGSGLTSAQVSSLNSRITTYLIAIGAN